MGRDAGTSILPKSDKCEIASDDAGTGKAKKLLAINGYWYDITNFIAVHPGGEVIGHFVGKDATAVFRGFHEKDVLKHWKPVGKYCGKRESHPEDAAISELHDRLQREGYFETSYVWYAQKFALTFALWAACWLLLKWNPTSLAVLAAAALMLFLFWQECGFFMHDFMHSQLSHQPSIDRWWGTLAGTVGVGICGHWWRDEHFVHHALTCTVDYADWFCDPQMTEPIWAQSDKLFPFFKHRLDALLIKIQHITFLPVCVIAGRVGIIVDSFKQERRWYEWVAFGLHWLWMSYLLSLIPTWSLVAYFYVLASLFEGILHVQLLISHYSKPFHFKKDICESTPWYRMQIETNINITNPWWFDWFHGGLNFHIEHHLFPRMPRHNYRQASVLVKEICNRFSISYDQCGWFEAIARTVSGLKQTSRHFKLDPR